MSRKNIARQLVLEKAILDVLGEANSETRAQAKDEYEPGDADSIKSGTGDDAQPLGRVRMDKGSQTWKVIDHTALAHWVDRHAPDALVTVVQINSTWLARVLKTGTARIEHIDETTGEVTHVDVTPDGVGLITSQPRLVVTTTDAAEDAARQLLTVALKELES